MLKIAGFWVASFGLLGLALGQAAQAAEAKAVLSIQDQIKQSESIQKRGSQLAASITKMLDTARRDKDIMRANCLNRKLTEVNANVRNVEGRQKALRDAANGEDEARANHEFTVLSVIAQKFDQADQEASQCLGQSVYESGASQVVTHFPGDGPTNDPSAVAPPPPAPPSLNAAPAVPTASPTPSARDQKLSVLQSVGLLPSTGTFTDKQVKDAQDAMNRLTEKRLEELKKDVTDSENQVRLRTDAQNSADGAKQKSDVFLGKNWIDRNGYVVQLNSKVLRPDANTVTKVEYTYRAEGPLAGTSIFSNRVSFNQALPQDWTVVYSRSLNDPANLGGGSPAYWRTLQQVSAFSPNAEGCLLCFTTQYVSPGPLGGGAWGQPYTYRITHVPTGGSAQTLLNQQFAADGSLLAGSDQLVRSYSNGSWSYSVTNGSTSTVLTLVALGLSDLGRTRLTLDGQGGGWSGLRDQIQGQASTSYVELYFQPFGSATGVDVLLSPAAFLEAF